MVESPWLLNVLHPDLLEDQQLPGDQALLDTAPGGLGSGSCNQGKRGV